MKNLIPCVERWWLLDSLEVKREAYVWLVNDSRGCAVMLEWFDDHTYWLRGVHVWITPRVVSSICGQHDFIDLIGFNDAIFWGQEKESVSLGTIITWPSGRDTLHNHAAHRKRRKATYTWMDWIGDFFESGYRQQVELMYHILTCKKSQPNCSIAKLKFLWYNL